MTARMIRIDDEYTAKFDEIVSLSNGHIEVVDDKNLTYDPYFYERKATLDKIIQAVDDGTVKMLSHDEFWSDLID
ncbi:MAG: hypothetical protein U9R39_03620 [Campylobacterota bacterium]|nr:hypothetical protein [Campylobacterota bacterium]